MRSFDDIARAALALPGIESAAIFVAKPDSSELELVAASGIEGPALDGLIAAVRNPNHPIARALSDTAPTFDVAPMNPGGPALRSHLPFAGPGVLALAHGQSLPPEARQTLQDLAASAGEAIASRPR